MSSSGQQPEADDDSRAEEEFRNRRTNLFAVLDQAEKDLGSKIAKTVAADARDIALGHSADTRTGGGRLLTKRFRGKDSLFVKPEIPPWRIIEKHRAPDFKLHPHKWTRYSLADVGDMNDKSNAAAAFAFLDEMHARKKCGGGGDDGDDDDRSGGDRKKIVFQRTVTARETNETKPTFRCGKLVMPEYEFGKKAQKPRRADDRKTADDRTAATKEIKLGHLMEEDDDDE